MEILNNVLEWVQMGGTILAIVTAIVTAAIACWGRFKTALSNKENSIKDIATAAIIEVERLLDASKEALKEAGLDTGAYKLSTVTATIQTACSNSNLKYDETYWSEFIESQVAILNATKIQEETL